MRVRYNCASHQREIPESKSAHLGKTPLDNTRYRPHPARKIGDEDASALFRAARAAKFPSTFADIRYFDISRERISRSCDFQDYAEGCAR